MTKKLILLASVAVLALGNTSEARAKISCVFSNNNAKVTISGEGSDVAYASSCKAENSSSTDDGWKYNSDWKNSVTNINIGNGVTSVGGYSFDGMSNVTSLTISDSVTKIGEGAFRGMSGVTSLTIPNSVKSIGGMAFMGMSGVQGQLVIPNSVTSLAGRAFEGMRGVTSLVIPDSVTTIKSRTFYGMSGVASLVIPDSVTRIESEAFIGMSGVTGELKIPEGVTSIGRSAFSGMTGVTSLTIPSSVTSIEYCAFNNLTGVTSLVIPEGVTSIGAYAFGGMNNLTGTLIIPDSVISIGDGAFQNDPKLKRIVLPDSIMDISNAFTQYIKSDLEEIIIPDSWADNPMLNLRDNMFYLLPKNTKIVCQGDEKKCQKALAKFYSSDDCPFTNKDMCSCTSNCISPSRIVAVENETQCGGGMYTWNETTGKCNRLSEFQCNDYRDENNKRKYYFNGNTCTKLPKDGKIACANSCYKINDGYCDRVCYTPAEAAEIAKDSGNVVTLTFKKQ